MPLEQIVAAELTVGDAVRIDDPQAQRVEPALRDEGRVELQLLAVALEAIELVRLCLPVDAVVDRLGTAHD